MLVALSRLLREALPLLERRRRQDGSRLTTDELDWVGRLHAEAQVARAEPPCPSTDIGSCPEVEPVFLSVEDAADRLGISERHTRRLLADGKLRGCKVGRYWLVEMGPHNEQRE